MPTSEDFSVNKLNQKGSILIILVFIFLAAAIVGGMLIYKTFTSASQKLVKTQEQLQVALKTEYSNPFDEKSSYDNPFSETHNPFDDLK